MSIIIITMKMYPVPLPSGNKYCTVQCKQHVSKNRTLRNFQANSDGIRFIINMH